MSTAVSLPSDPNARRLSGLDAAFLASEPMQIIALGLLRAGSGGPLALEDLHRHLAARLDQLPSFRCRVVPVPLGLAPPMLVEDPLFDLGSHLCHAILPEPGGPEELDALCGQLVSQGLDRGRPLWRITLVDGLADGRQAVALEVHHALMDGIATGTTLARIFGTEEPAPSPVPWQPGRMPGRWQLVTGALIHDVRMLARLPKLVGRARCAAEAVSQRQQGVAVKVPQGVDAPLSAINQGFTLERRFARASLPLENVLTVKEVAGVTVNDVALALVSGALRGYLQARRALPDRSLLARVPVSSEVPGAGSRAVGNRFSALTTTLATDVADPWERLQRISAVTAEAKVCLDLRGRELLADTAEYFPPMLMGLIARRDEAARRHPGKRGVKLDTNVVVSNLRGPSARWQLGSTVVEEMYIAPPGSGVGMNFLLWDYAGRLLFGIMSFAGLVEDLREVVVGLSCALDELVKTVEAHRVPTT